MDKTPPAETPPTRAGTSDQALTSDRGAGAALRSAYQQTIEEAVPDEMLDLLSKLD